jgi:hypothetical protein
MPNAEDAAGLAAADLKAQCADAAPRGEDVVGNREHWSWCGLRSLASQYQSHQYMCYKMNNWSSRSLKRMEKQV